MQRKLEEAIRKNKGFTLRRLIAKGAKVNRGLFSWGRTTLIYAIWDKCKLSTIKILLKAGAKVNMQDDWGRTALMEAASQGRTDVMRLLLEAGAVINKKDKNKTTALMFACLQGKVEAAKLLLAAGADCWTTDSSGTTTLMLAAETPEGLPLLEILLDKGLNVNAHDEGGDTALMMAARFGTAAMVKKLIEAGADVNAKDGEGETALIMAANHNDNPVETMRLLYEAGDTSMADEEGTAAVLTAAAGNSKITEEAIRKLLASIRDGDRRHRVVTDALIKACESGNAATVKLLLEAGADVNIDGNSPALLEACRRDACVDEADIADTPIIVEYLIKAGANVNSKDTSSHCVSKGKTPLMCAVNYGANPKAAKALIDAGADINARCEGFGWTVLVWAVESLTNPAPMVDLLLDAGVDTEVLVDGEKAAVWAIWNDKLWKSRTHKRLRKATSPYEHPQYGELRPPQGKK